MKNYRLFSACMLFALCGTLSANATGEDTTRIFESGNKRIIVKDNEQRQRTEVQVYEMKGYRDSTLYEKIFEGHYRDGNSYEQRRYLPFINIPSPRWKSRIFDPHWAGFGMGFAGFTNEGNAHDIPLKSSRSLEYNLNIYEHAIPISNRFRWALVTGFGFRWTRYHLKGNLHFEEIDNYTELVTIDDVRYKKSRLGITHITLPLLLEWQDSHDRLFFSVGVVGSVKTASSSRVEYYKVRGYNRKEKIDAGMTLRPVSIDILAQVGFNDWGAFARYSPISIFEHWKGPELYPLSFGLMLHF